jgi:hypothetical protein
VLFTKFKKAASFSIRVILYAPRRIISPNLTRRMGLRDIPIPGSIIERGEPLCSIVVSGRSREIIFRRAFEKVDSIYRLVS